MSKRFTEKNPFDQISSRRQLQPHIFNDSSRYYDQSASGRSQSFILINKYNHDQISNHKSKMSDRIRQVKYFKFDTSMKQIPTHIH